MEPLSAPPVPPLSVRISLVCFSAQAFARGFAGVERSDGSQAAAAAAYIVSGGAIVPPLPDRDSAASVAGLWQDALAAMSQYVHNLLSETDARCAASRAGAGCF